MSKWTIEDYIERICEIRNEAAAAGKTYVDLNSKALLEACEPGVRNLPAVCRAISRAMLEGDKFLEKPNGFAAVGVKLTVRFYVDNLSPQRRRYLDVLKEEKLAQSMAKYSDELSAA